MIKVHLSQSEDENVLRCFFGNGQCLISPAGNQHYLQEQENCFKCWNPVRGIANLLAYLKLIYLSSSWNRICGFVGSDVALARIGIKFEVHLNILVDPKYTNNYILLSNFWHNLVFEKSIFDLKGGWDGSAWWWNSRVATPIWTPPPPSHHIITCLYQVISTSKKLWFMELFFLLLLLCREKEVLGDCMMGRC